jgi:hypothetical protein
MHKVDVECYAGHRADQRPLRFVIRGRSYQVAEVEDQWYSPEAIYFRVVADDGNRYVLRHDERTDVWTLEAFRSLAAESGEDTTPSSHSPN